MSYSKDIFISYAHIDNQPLTPGEQGWITRFHATLEALLNMRLGHKAQIWRDEKLQGNDVFSDEIMEQFPETAVLLSILTPRYLTSEWCTREMAEFCKTAEQSDGLVLDNKARVFKVLKSPLDTQEALPSVVKDVLGYEFYTYENAAPLELDEAYGEQYGQAYKRKVAQLASDVSELLKQLISLRSDQESDTVSADLPADKPVLYLAECSFDRREAREILACDLRQHGYTVLPDRELPRDELEYIAAVVQLLEQCCLSIHLVGDRYGAVPDGPSGKSVIVLQNELAAEHSSKCGLQRVIWLPADTNSEQDHQTEFIQTLHQDAKMQFGADLITGDIETLKSSIHSTLTKQQNPANLQVETSAIESDGAKLIYLICTERDRKATVPVRKFFREQGLDVAIPAFEGDAAAVRENHRQLMSSCDAVMVFYGDGDEAWKRTLDNELKKLPGYREGRPLLARSTYLAAPRTADKEDLIDMEEPNLIQAFDDFLVDSMDEFTQALLAETGEVA